MKLFRYHIACNTQQTTDTNHNNTEQQQRTMPQSQPPVCATRQRSESPPAEDNKKSRLTSPTPSPGRCRLPSAAATFTSDLALSADMPVTTDAFTALGHSRSTNWLSSLSSHGSDTGSEVYVTAADDTVPNSAASDSASSSSSGSDEPPERERPNAPTPRAALRFGHAEPESPSPPSGRRDGGGDGMDVDDDEDHEHAELDRRDPERVLDEMIAELLPPRQRTVSAATGLALRETRAASLLQVGHDRCWWPKPDSRFLMLEVIADR